MSGPLHSNVDLKRIVEEEDDGELKQSYLSLKVKQNSKSTALW